MLAPGLFTAEEVIEHLRSEIAAAEAERLGAFVPASLSMLEDLPKGEDSYAAYGAFTADERALTQGASLVPIGAANSVTRLSVATLSRHFPMLNASALPLSHSGRRQLNRLTLLMNGLAERYAEFEQLTTSPPAAALSSNLQAVQMLVASCGAGILPDPWSQHVSIRHVGHWLGTRKLHFRFGKAKASVGTQTTLQHDKDYRAMRTTLVSFVASGEEPVARQALLCEERGAFVAFMLMHQMVRRMCELPAFRISTIATHKRLIQCALEEETAEQKHRSPSAVGTPSTAVPLATNSAASESFCASILIDCGTIDHYSRPQVECKTDLISHVVVGERSARQDVYELCKATYERIALQRHMDLQRILANCDQQEMAFQLQRERHGLQKIKRQQQRAKSILFLLQEEK